MCFDFLFKPLKNEPKKPTNKEKDFPHQRDVMKNDKKKKSDGITLDDIIAYELMDDNE